ncbi:MAG: VOC family protein [Bacilli bacterium]
MKFTMVHCNLNVMDVGRSVLFYQEALGLHEVRRVVRSGFILVYLADETEAFQLELTQLLDRVTPYDLGDNESHLAFRTDDYEAAHAHHQAMGVICYENPTMGIYFIEDPDGYWLEVIPPHKVR